MTLPTGLFEPTAAPFSRTRRAIFLRLSDNAGLLVAGQLVQAAGIRSTWTGMESIRLSEPPLQQGIGIAASPAGAAHGDHRRGG